MAGLNGKHRYNVTLSNELAEWVEKEADKYGCTISSILAIATGQYKQQQDKITNEFELIDSVGEIRKELCRLKISIFKSKKMRGRRKY